MRSKRTGQGKGDASYFAPHVPPFTLGGRKRNGDNGGKHYTPWLVIRAQVGDDGSRPLPGGEVFWESPDVWVTSTLGVNQPVPGQANTVFARVSNLGLQDAVGVFVEFYWVDPSLAINLANANLIGIGSVDVTAGSAAVATCPTPWVPVIENGGHECLIAEAFLPASDPLTAPLDPVDDRHVGQKNEQLVLAQPGQHMKVRLKAANIAGFAQALTIDVQGLRLTQIPALLSVRNIDRARALTPAPGVLPLSLDMAEHTRTFCGPSATFARRLLSMTLQEVAGTAQAWVQPAQISHRESFEPWETRSIEVAGQVPPNAQLGQVFAFRVIQRAGLIAIGGYTIYVVVTGS
ncbi:MAG: hypothetical protein ACHQRJ_10415 [Alphaproteobacteria bacterium]